MSRILKVSQGDYRLQVQSGGVITLDTGEDTGTVVVTGNLDVKGVTTTVESTNTTIADNILQLNYGQTGDGISSTLNYQSGIEIGRGSRQAAKLVFDERLRHYDSVISADVEGSFVLKTADDVLSGLRVRTLSNDGLANLVFDLRGGTPVIRIANATNYHQRVVNDNDIPNRKFITTYVAASSGIADVYRIIYPLSGDTITSVVADGVDGVTDPIIRFQLFGSDKAVMNANGFVVDGQVSINQSTINNVSSNNLVLTAAINHVEVDAILNLDHQAVAPSTVDFTGTQLYSKSTGGPGKTGLYVLNSVTSDELVSRRRAVLFSILL